MKALIVRPDVFKHDMLDVSFIRTVGYTPYPRLLWVSVITLPRRLRNAARA
jgi:hypothetical protein